MNHKRGKPKNARSGCLMCKPWKCNHAKDKRPVHEQARRDAMKRESKDDA